jgi:hypothetical protein
MRRCAAGKAERRRLSRFPAGIVERGMHGKRGSSRNWVQIGSYPENRIPIRFRYVAGCK